MVWLQKFRKHALGKYLWLTNTISCGGLLALGDCIQQFNEKTLAKNKAKSYDWGRTGRMFLVGLSQGPPHHIWYTWLDRKIPRKNASAVVKKILADQLIAAPFFAFTFFIGMGILEGKKFSGGVEEFKKKFAALYLFDWCFWPPVQYINFVWIPTEYRVTYVNVATVAWDVFLSYIKHYDQ
ncbi:hypothetical protein J437_LFUL000198 [Ladona fulva]|uniref:Mpv17-like protein 2 n=1 Tax=Ladona fulva TaxID=123851 RepID=A0A8K0KAK0_LADFU|nr:hypothetical protein J437_LFUL000198 [Ladona fulva]